MTYVIYQSGAAHKATPRLAASATKVVFTTQPSGAVNGSNLTGQPVVQLQDAFNQPIAIPGISITILRSAGSATLSGTVTVATDATGKATFTDLKLTGVAGSHTFTASSSGLTSAVSASFTLAAGAGTQLVISTQPTGAVAGSPLTSQPRVRIEDVSFNAVAQAGVTITVVKHSGVVGTLSGTLTAVTDSSGIATFTDLAMSAAESGVTLDFSASGLTGITSAAFTVTAAGSSAGAFKQTTFNATENPISESGDWHHTDTTTTPMKTSGGHAFGTQTGSNGTDDSIAYLTGFGTDYEVEGTLFIAGGIGGFGGSHEVELWLRVDDTGPQFSTDFGLTSTIGYEINIPSDGSFMSLARFKDPSSLQDFVGAIRPGGGAPQSGDRFKVRVDGQRIRCWYNGTLRIDYTDNGARKITTGGPGMAAFISNPAANTNFGFDMIRVSDAAWAPNFIGLPGTWNLLTDYPFNATTYAAVSDSGANFDATGETARSEPVSGWAINGNGGSGMSKVTDATQLHSPSNALDVLYPGSGAGGGGNGSLGIDLGGLGAVKRLYLCCDVWHASDAELNSISNKMFVVFCNAGAGGNYNMEYRFNSAYFCLLDGPGSGQINGPNFGAPGTALNTYVMMEWRLDAIAGVSQFWVNGVLQWTYNAALFTPWDSLLLSSTWGGGGTHTHAWHRRMGHCTVHYSLT